MASGIAFSSFLGLQGPAVDANHALRGAGVKAEARRGRATRGALTPVSTGLDFTAAGPSPETARNRAFKVVKSRKMFPVHGAAWRLCVSAQTAARNTCQASLGV